jgi:hypothetical protein
MIVPLVLEGVWTRNGRCLTDDEIKAWKRKNPTVFDEHSE